MLDKRGCGVLLHPTSLPGVGGIGTMGQDACRFIDLLADMGMSYWQVLPLTPPACGNSPYSAFSAFAGNPLLIDLHQIIEESDLPDVCNTLTPSTDSVDFETVSKYKSILLKQAGSAFLAQDVTPRKVDFWRFCDTTPWLHEYALFMSLKEKFNGKPWSKWPKSAALLSPVSYEKYSVELGAEIGIHKYIQWQFYRQWKKLRARAASKGVRIIGDLPIFVAHDSADVWGKRDLFMLDVNGRSTVVAGVPPDYFCKFGQLWGNPLYDWQKNKNSGYSWWIDRFRSMFEMYDIVRIDHFRGFEAAWHVPATHRTAQHGCWVPGPGIEFFDTVTAALGSLQIIAEDLGVITPQVEFLRDRYGFPGMKILQFAFDSDSMNAYLPHNHCKNSIVYSGTHDNDTTTGWYNSLSDSQVRRVREYLGMETGNCVSALIRSVFMSVADTAVVPFQDLLMLDSSARMNVPGNAVGNWGWRFKWDMIPDGMTKAVSNMNSLYGRQNKPPQ